jgi:N-ethylmaleimide reductase
MINPDLIKKREVIEEGYADLVAYGKPYIANPDLVERFEHNLAPEADQDTFYSGGAKDIPIIQTLLNKELKKLN